MSADVNMRFAELQKLRGTRIHDPKLYQASSPRYIHTIVFPQASYSPWLEDPAFVESHNLVTGNSLVDYYRVFELWSLVAQTAHLGGDILEVGVWRGGTGCMMAAHAKRVAPTARVILCDTFAGMVKAGENDTYFRGGELSDTSVQIVADLAARMGLDNVEIRKGIFPDETAAGLENRRFSLCHIDVDVYDSGAHVLDWVWPRLHTGGVVVFDDYGFQGCDGITQLVNERATLPSNVMLHNLNGHAVLVKTE